MIAPAAAHLLRLAEAVMRAAREEDRTTRGNTLADLRLALDERLIDPAAHTGDPADAFSVVAPTIPGHGFSAAPSDAGFEDRAAADLFAELMTGLGYERFGLHAYGIGASIGAYLCLDHPERVIGYHTTDPGNPGPYLGPGSPELSEAEHQLQAVRADWRQREGAYAQILGTKHQTLGYALNDSPAGLAAWIVEKCYAWTVPPSGDLEAHFTKDELLTNVTIYWVTGSINAANRYYAELPEPWGPDDRFTMPTAIAVPPKRARQVAAARVHRVLPLRHPPLGRAAKRRPLRRHRGACPGGR